MEKKPVRRRAQDRSIYNGNVDIILSRHLANLIATYGEQKLFKVLADVHGLVKPETKAS